MSARFFGFFRSTRLWTQKSRGAQAPRISQFVCRTCRSKFSTSALLRQIAEKSKIAIQKTPKNYKSPQLLPDSKKYPENLKIYDAGDMRTSWVAFWKATCIFQFGFVCVFIAPQFYNNANQPNPNERALQTGLIVTLAFLPVAAMSYLTSPFVKTVAIRVPEYARRSHEALLRWSQNVPSDTKLDLTTLRVFPFRKTSAVYLFELRALAPGRGRFANIERVRTPELGKMHRGMSFGRKLWYIIDEPRWKFYVKEGRAYTQRTGAYGVWENVAKAIHKQTEKLAAKASTQPGKSAGVVKTKAKGVEAKGSRVVPAKKGPLRTTSR